jgi:hypothetical protein
MRLPQPAPASKPASAAERRTRPDSKRPKPPREVSNLELWTVLSETPLNRDVLAVVEKGKELLAFVREALGTHTGNGLVKGLRAVGLGHYANDHHRETGDNLLADLSGLEFVLDVGVGLLASAAYPTPPTAEERAQLRKSR